MAEPTAGRCWRTGTAEALWPRPGEGTLNPRLAPGPCCQPGAAGALAQAPWPAHPSAGRPRCRCPACWARSQGLQQNSRKNTEQRVPGKCTGRAHQQPHLALHSTAQSPGHCRRGNAVTIRQHHTPALPSCRIGCMAIAVSATMLSRTAATPDDQISKPPLFSRCKGTDSLFVKLSTTSTGLCYALFPAQLGRGSFGV